MITWSGLGILTPVFLVGSVAGAQIATSAYFGPGYMRTHPWVNGVGLGVGGLLCWFVGAALYRSGTRQFMGGRAERDPNAMPSHTFFYIPMHWIGMLAVLAAVPVGIYGLPQSKDQKATGETVERVGPAPKPPQPRMPPPIPVSTTKLEVSVAEAQELAMQRYPELRIAGSKFNSAFLAILKQARTDRPQLLQNNNWPLILADETYEKLK